ncbi:hypothetical protein FACS1894105_13150 [Clostridia bacterium]|nr:hypothetical protein FACS1894105_13150 [Clostridia bacterium]
MPFEDNVAVQKMIADIEAAIAHNIKGIVGSGISGTTAFLLANKDGKSESLAKVYGETVDYAIMQVKSGNADYHSAMRRAIKNMSDEGISTVEYDSGYHRRLDTSIRNAFSGGMQKLSQAQSEQLGTEIGADGMEVTYHVGARETHIDMGGEQFTMDYFKREIQPLLDEPNCYHRAYPVLLGISARAYTPDEVKELHKNDREKSIEFEGKKYTAYEASQMQRRIETAIRREKDRAVNFAASGDKDQARVSKAKVAALNGKYKQFNDATGLKSKDNRLTVSGYTGGKVSAETLAAAKANIKAGKVAGNAQNSLTSGANSGIIEPVKTAEYELEYSAVSGKVDVSGKQYTGGDGDFALPGKITTVTHTELKSTPNSITRTVAKKGGITLNYYGEDGRQYKQISNNNHGNPKEHPYGNNGEHAHDYIWRDGGTVDRPMRELTEAERKENSDIL